MKNIKSPEENKEVSVQFRDLSLGSSSSSSSSPSASSTSSPSISEVTSLTLNFFTVDDKKKDSLTGPLSSDNEGAKNIATHLLKFINQSNSLTPRPAFISLHDHNSLLLGKLLNHTPMEEKRFESLNLLPEKTKMPENWITAAKFQIGFKIRLANTVQPVQGILQLSVELSRLMWEKFKESQTGARLYLSELLKHVKIIKPENQLPPRAAPVPATAPVAPESKTPKSDEQLKAEKEALETVKELEPVLGFDFNQATEDCVAWLGFELETHVREYLTKILNQSKIALRILQHMHTLTQAHPLLLTGGKALNILNLWKTVRKKDVKLYFKHIARQLEAIKNTEVSPNEVTSPCTRIKPFFLEEVSEILSEYPSSTISYDWLLDDGAWIPYDPAEIKTIRQAQEEKKDSLDLIIRERHYQLNFKTMMQTSVKSKNPQPNPPSLFAPVDIERPFVKVFQYPKQGPYFWKSAEVKTIPDLVSVSPYHPDTLIYRATRAILQCEGYAIVRMEINYNPEEWLLYWNLREDYRKRLPGLEERFLWHGTDAKSANFICAQGFKRDLGKNFAYGKGCYFACSPLMSLRTEYAKLSPEEKGNDQVLIGALVTIGDSTPGENNRRQSWVKDINLLRFENTDDRNKTQEFAKLFVTYDDHQAFPAIKVTVRRTVLIPKQESKDIPAPASIPESSVSPSNSR